MKKMIERYFDAWIQKDAIYLSDLFAEHVVYSECYGPEYFGLEQILRWFHDWNEQGTVLKWEIKQFIEQDNICVAEWYFKCEYCKEVIGFNGVSIIQFDDNSKIVHLKEFQSKEKHIYPYGKY